MKRSRWGDWFEHLHSVVLCIGQSAYWAEED